MTHPDACLSHSSSGAGHSQPIKNQFYSIQQAFNSLLQLSIYRNSTQPKK
ncbi:hypothetical protein [Acinetobacter thermotolerans]